MEFLLGVDPLPRTYVREIGMRGVLSFDLEATFGSSSGRGLDR
jgi:hypothetical protein